ncbi:GDP-mannose 4,6-dehydratase [Micromonospora craniellae]|uniref:NAD-dependent epimerase/dehydratase family protein n=1 Tax=Micromonospora craniellae TaxID=2294034 RepID=A0A372FRT8_9ACTN|nr:GDP-mannose 4,6-dehydratase [Micromonospora craniellae]QOC93470.1 GDP-mannose 4,6-dehydratase [Micromonospora craniellae]RFS43461.1 NAD-dependent epimerase/dehydratase family protein [Micromonospora craniellae]
MKAMVTGGAGFIGSHVVEQLLARGDEVVVLDDFSTGLEDNLRAATGGDDSRLRTYRVDIADDTAAAIVRQEAPDALLLIAAQSSVKVSMRDPMEDARVNVIGMLKMLEAAKASACRKVVFASSGGTIYGSVDEDRLPLREDYPTAPVSFYGVTKAALGHYLAVYRMQAGLDYAALALGNVYGPRQSPHGEAGVVSIFAGNILSGRPCVINGDGRTTRDYVHVKDVARAFVLATERGTGLMNIGTGLGTSVNEIHQLVGIRLGTDLVPVRGRALPGEVRRVVLDNTTARTELGWEPRISLDEGIVTVLDWLRTLPAGHPSAPRPATVTSA